MPANTRTTDTSSSGKRQARLLRIAAAAVLLLGIFGGDAVYWLGMRSPALSDDPSVVGYDKKEARQMGILAGNQGLWVDELAQDLKHPGTQAVIIVVAAALVAGGCLYVARLLDNRGDPARETSLPQG